MIGFYDYTVIMTYISVVSSMIGIFCAVTDHISAAVCCLAFSGLCDMFDGKIARTKKNRTEEEKCFRIQIDSLADNVCFGIHPFVLGFKLGLCHIYGIAILLFYGLALVIVSKFTYSSIVWLGYAFICLGVVDCFWEGHSLLFWTIGFGGFHILYGILFYLHYERKRS